LVQLPQLRVQTEEGRQQFYGEVWQASAKLGKSLWLADQWRVDPYLSLTGVQQSWSEAEGFGGLRVKLKPETWTTIQGGARLTYQPSVNESLRGWLELSAWETLDGGTSTVQLSATRESADYNGHQLGSATNVAAGLMGEYDERVEWNGKISYSQGMSGTAYSEVEASVGLRIRW
jgi:hypothetical protein